ncbi:MAG: hypothetical protein ACSHYB_16225 [Roseibacillus sp.]
MNKLGKRIFIRQIVDVNYRTFFLLLCFHFEISSLSGAITRLHFEPSLDTSFSYSPVVAASQLVDEGLDSEGRTVSRLREEVEDSGGSTVDTDIGGGTMSYEFRSSYDSATASRTFSNDSEFRYSLNRTVSASLENEVSISTYGRFSFIVIPRFELVIEFLLM